MDIWVVSSFVYVLQVKLLRTYLDIYLVNIYNHFCWVYIYLEVELLRHAGCIYLPIVDSARELSKVFIPIYSLPGSARVSVLNMYSS